MSEIIYTQTKWADVSRVMEKIMTAVDGEDDSVVIISCLAFTVSAQMKDYTFHQLSAGIKGTSEYIALYASSVDPDATIQQVN